MFLFYFISSYNVFLPRMHVTYTKNKKRTFPEKKKRNECLGTIITQFLRSSYAVMPKKKSRKRATSATESKAKKAKLDVYAVDMEPAKVLAKHHGRPMCSICHEDIDKDQDAVLRDCRHRYHRACIEHWVQINNSCPMCRAERPQIVSPQSSLRCSSAIDTHVFPKMKVYDIIKNTDDKYTLSLFVTDEVFWGKMDEFDWKMRNTFMANPQWFRNKDPKFHETFMNESVKSNEARTRGWLRVKVFAPRKDFLTPCGTEVGREVDGMFGRTSIRFDRACELYATCTVQSKVWMRSNNHPDINVHSEFGGVVFEAMDLEMSYKAKLNPPR